MDPQVRQFKDFLQLYNTITEKCFNSCVDNLLSRNVENNEDSCVGYCVDKFAKVNQRIMGTYVEVQSKINNKRMQEYEVQMKQAEELAAQQQELEQVSPETTPAAVEAGN